MSDLKLFIPITKVDAAQRLVYGVATAEAPDRSGEICDYQTTKPLYEKWSGDIEKATGGKSLGNVRAMHGPVAAGKVTQISFNDEDKQIEICAKVVDDAEWKKVEEGVYTGFSQGGSYVKRWKDPENGDLMRYTADPTEVSLVDLPCLPDATFSMIKADGAVEMRKFVVKEKPAGTERKTPTSMEIAKRATELAEADGGHFASYIERATADLEQEMNAAKEPAVSDSIEKAAETDPRLNASAGVKNFTPSSNEHGDQVWRSNRDGKLFAKKADMVAYNDEYDAKKAVEAASAPVDDLVAKINEQLERKTTPKAGRNVDEESQSAVGVNLAILEFYKDKDPELGIDFKKLATANAVKGERQGALPKNWKESTKEGSYLDAFGLDKGLWTVSRLAEVLSTLESLKCDVALEAECEKDGSTLPRMAKDALETLVAFFRAMVDEETSEMLAADGDEFEMAYGLSDSGFASVRKFLSPATIDAVIAKKAVDRVEAGRAAEKAAEETAKKAAVDATEKDESADLAKFKVLNDALLRKLEAQEGVLKELLEKVTNIEEQPLPLPLQGAAGAVSRGAEDGNSPDAMYAKAVRDLVNDPDRLVQEGLKFAHASPKKFFN
jgi:hypothetical protein